MKIKPKYTLAIFNKDLEFVCKVETSFLEDMVSMAEYKGFYCFTLWRNSDYNTNCFTERGSTTNQQVHDCLLEARQQGVVLWE